MATSRVRRYGSRYGGALLVLLALTVVGLAVAVDRRPARLVSASPTDGARLTAAPTVVSMTFTGRPDADEVHLRVTDGGGVPVPAGSPAVRGRSVRLPVTLDRDGAYRLAYHVRLGDGRDVSGAVSFTVAAGLAGGRRPTGAATASPAGAPAGAPVGAPVAGHDHGATGPVDLLLLAVPVLLGLALLAAAVRGRRLRHRVDDPDPPLPSVPRRRREWVLREPGPEEPARHGDR